MKRLVYGSVALLLVLIAAAGIGPRIDGVMMWVDLGRPPHPLLVDGEEAGHRLQAAGPDEQFPHTFYYGEACGHRLPLAEVALRGEAVPRALRSHFFDGVGHGYATSTDDIEATIAVIADHIPPTHAVPIHAGVLRHHTMSAGGDPAAVVPFAERYAALAGLSNPYNGVRIGLQRALGDQLDSALQTAARYPPDYWPALFEELGWRSSSLQGAAEPTAGVLEDETVWRASTASVLAHAAHVPEVSRCHYFHGAIRGRVLRSPWQEQSGWQRIQEEIDGFDQDCQAAAYQGVAWGVFIHASHSPSHVEAMLAGIHDPAAQDLVRAAYRRVVAPPAAKGTEQPTPLAPWDIAL